MDTIFRKYRSKGEVWQLGWHRALFWSAEEGSGRPFRPCVLVCLSLRTGRSHSTFPGTGEPGPEAFRELVMETARAWRLRPERIEVTDARMAEDLRGHLSAAKVSVELRSDLPALRALLEQRVRSLRSTLPPPALDAPGVTVERMAAFAEAAARFSAAAPWRHLDLDDVLSLEAADLPRELREVQVRRSPAGLSFHPQTPEGEPGPPEEEEKDWDWEDDWSEEEEEEEGLWKVSLVPLSDLPPEDAELWLEHGLPFAGSGTCPLALRRTEDGVERPDACHLRWFEVVLDALASTTEEEMDTGRWEKEVATSGGPVRLALSLPDLLEPARADRLTFEDGDDLPRDVRLADELTTEAWGAFGRRRSQLARRAVALWPDAIDAWLLLGHCASDPETARDLYARAVAAGERLLPGIERRAVPFDEHERRSYAPYYWARSSLARALWTLEAREEALDHLRWLQAVYHDREGAWDLAHALLALAKDEEAEDLLARYADPGPDWLYVRALLTFRREGASPSARRQMAAALAQDRHLGKQLLGESRFEEIEVESPTVSFQQVWEETPGALEALRAESAALAAAARVRKGRRKGEKKRRRRR
jgi:tetratricopeptide (TPR) repeat protein